jgi:GNAT superfamily N-acetyltransferase
MDCRPTTRDRKGEPLLRSSSMTAKIRKLEERDLDEADRIVRLAFGTFLGFPDPMQMFGDADLARTRWRANPDAALAAELDERLVGSNFVADWGTVGFFGPLSVDPALWERKIARQLLDATMELFAAWGTRHMGLFTFPNSPKHLALYQKYGFWPRYLTAVMAKPVASLRAPAGMQKFSALSKERKAAAIRDCRAVTDSLYEGLDLRREIEAVDLQKLGDTILLYDGPQLAALAICHTGAGTEAGSGACYVKFAAVRRGPHAARDFGRLLEACETYAGERGVPQLEAGVNTERHAAYRAMIERGFRTFLTGVVMQHSNDPGYNRADAFILDDWR